MRQFLLLGHRGSRGLYPENTLKSFKNAFDMGMDGIEMDVQLSKDNQIIVYHDYSLNPDITTDADGHWLCPPTPAIRELSLAQLKRFKLGRLNKKSNYGMRYLKQKCIPEQTIPTLDEVIEYLRHNGYGKKLFNIEIKHSPLSNVICASENLIAEKVIKKIHDLNIANQCIVSCFNWRVLQEIKQLDKTIKLSCLTITNHSEDTVSAVNNQRSLWNDGLDIRDFAGSVVEMVNAFGVKHWSPYYKNISDNDIKQAKSHDIKIITWTVNHKASMKRLFDQGIDGIICDYPNSLTRIAKNFVRT